MAKRKRCKQCEELAPSGHFVPTASGEQVCWDCVCETCGGDGMCLECEGTGCCEHCGQRCPECCGDQTCGDCSGSGLKNG